MSVRPFAPVQFMDLYRQKIGFLLAWVHELDRYERYTFICRHGGIFALLE